MRMPEYLGARLANYKVPRLIVLDPELPRDESGKLFKRKIKAQYWHQTSRV
jgi:long-chain acyl-CoA synthetase|nr:acyl-CoA synthetase domain protein [Rhodococcus sp. JVH1]